ncbi:hypothetical protein ACFVKC_40515 [Streptomyces noursei]|uniref:hypothetical protein n=1 Tax=Streptomyces noursei TaxID=1971 RepID=UPI00363A5CF9
MSANDAGVHTLKGEVFNEEFDVIDSSKVIDVVAKLVRKNSALENQVRMTQNNTEGLAQEIASLTSKVNELREITESNTADIVFLDERAQTHNFAVNLRIDRESDVGALTELFTKILSKDGAAE